MNKVTQRIDRMRADRGWTVYRLAEESGVSNGTIRNWFSTDTYPLIPALESICAAFGISLANFFADGNLVELTPEKKALCEDFDVLTKSERDAVKAIIKSYKDNK